MLVMMKLMEMVMVKHWFMKSHLSHCFHCQLTLENKFIVGLNWVIKR
uniref:Uncharacterized protein n=1 Tax=Rhizophora mucronata TaxID=61149 RepID=A0A2P2Q6C7_RHIMU